MSYTTKQLPRNTFSEVGVLLSICSGTAHGTQLRLRVRPQTQTQLGWKIGERFSLEIGKSANVRRIKISRDERGYRATKDYSSLRLIFPPWKALPTEPHAIRHCEFKIEDSELIVTLPDWI